MPTTTTLTPDLLTIPEVAGILRVAPGSIKRLARNGAFPRVRVGRSVRYRRDDVNAFIERSVVVGPIR